MKLIVKYLRPFALILVLCILLLFGQAMCDLSLPNLMSDIVNVGIQQGGIQEGAPKAMSQNGMTLLKFFMNSEQQAIMEDSYTLVQPGDDTAYTYVEEYPLLQSDPIYILNTEEEATLTEIATAYGEASLGLVSYVRTLSQESGLSAQGLDSEDGISQVDMSQLYGLIPVLSSLPAGSLVNFIQASADSDSMLYSQTGTAFTKLLYQELGVDLNGLQQSYITSAGLKMLGVALLGVVAAIAVGYFASKVAGQVSRKIRRDLFAKVESFSNAEYNNFSTASLITRTTNDVQQVQMLVTLGIRLMCYAPIMGIGGIIFALDKSISMSWIIALGVVVLIGLILVVFAIAMPKFKALQKLIDKLNLVSRENLSGMMVVRAFDNEEHEEQRFDVANTNLTNTTRFVQRVMSFMMPAMMLIMNLINVLIVWVGGHAIAESTMQVGDMMAFMQYAMQIIMAFLMISLMFIMVPRAAVSASRIQEVLDTPLVITDVPNPTPLNQIQGLVEFHDVSFRYDQAESNVLEHISFTAKPGQTTAFIGSTGAGKTTLINLIPRFYDVTQGSITIGGIDIRQVSQEELRDKIGYVPQKGILFSGDIESNIRYGKEDATPEEIDQAIEVAQAKDFVSETEYGIKTPIAQGGTNVSGGQKQRLAIARALVKRAPIYIFDDSFSALDFKTDAALRRALKTYTKNATVLIVAQRVSTIMYADQIIVLHDGKIAGKGTHKELLASCPEYREIAESQLQKEELE